MLKVCIFSYSKTKCLLFYINISFIHNKCLIEHVHLPKYKLKNEISSLITTSHIRIPNAQFTKLVTLLGLKR